MRFLIPAAVLVLVAPTGAPADEAASDQGKAAEKSAQTGAAKADAAAKPAATAKPAEKPARTEALPSLAKLAVCKDVQERKPIGESASFSSDVGQLYCFTWVETKTAPVQLFHRWFVGEKMVNEIPINVKGERWRCWSTKSILPSWKGACRVEVVTEEGDVLGTKKFTLSGRAAGPSSSGAEADDPADAG